MGPATKREPLISKPKPQIPSSNHMYENSSQAFMATRVVSLYEYLCNEIPEVSSSDGRPTS